MAVEDPRIFLFGKKQFQYLLHHRLPCVCVHFPSSFINLHFLSYAKRIFVALKLTRRLFSSPCYKGEFANFQRQTLRIVAKSRLLTVYSVRRKLIVSLTSRECLNALT